MHRRCHLCSSLLVWGCASAAQGPREAATPAADPFHAINRWDDMLAGKGDAMAEGTELVGGENSINSWNDVLDSLKNEGNGLYYAFSTARSDVVWSGQVEGRPGTWATSTTVFPLASASKLFTGFAVMRTMQLKPQDVYPEKFVNEFPGWEDFANFPVHGSDQRVNLTIHQLLTHTSGLPFGLRYSKEDLQGQKLFYMPGTAFGYTLGHRVMGWVLRDYWKTQPETQEIGIQTVQDTYKWLIFDKLGLSCSTRFDVDMNNIFGFTGQAGDAAISSTGEDLSKLAVVALRKGELPDGTEMISKKNWDKWAVPNLLPGGKLSKDLVSWNGAAASWSNWNVGGLKGKIMKQSGDFGWNYFGAVYYDSREIGWCGFFSSCLRVSYPQDLAFVVMQQNVADLEKSKPYLVAHFDEMARSLQCQAKSKCVGWEKTSTFCESCSTECKDDSWTAECPANTQRGKALYPDTFWSSAQHACYVPHCTTAWWAPWVDNSKCNVDSGGTCSWLSCDKSRGTCSWLSCDKSRGPTTCVRGACLCQEGLCAQEGKCQRPDSLSTCCRDTGGTCSVLGCDASRGATCVDGRCMCGEGQCAEAGHCMEASSVGLALNVTEVPLSGRPALGPNPMVAGWLLAALLLGAAISAGGSARKLFKRQTATLQEEDLYVKIAG